jgi:hypothetical protein
MRTKIVAGNWKMNKNCEETEDLLNELIEKLPLDKEVQIVVAPTFVNLASAVDHLEFTNITVAAQNLHQAESGAYTGEISADMLKSVGVNTVILGHSERRAIFHETDAIIANLSPVTQTEPVATTAAMDAKPLSKASMSSWDCVGLDVFVHHDGLPSMPQQIGNFTLRLMSNRGTKVWPGPTPDILLVDHYRCRYVSDAPISRQEALGVLTELTAQQVEWLHVELLWNNAGEAKYTKAQGE